MKQCLILDVLYFSDSVTVSNGASYSPDDWGAMGSSGQVNNINLGTNIVNGGGEISPQSSHHPHGSPLRGNLALKLKAPIKPTNTNLQVSFNLLLQTLVYLQ